MNLDLNELGTGQHHFLTVAAGLNFAHAASVCLESQSHGITSPVGTEGYFMRDYTITRLRVTDQMKRTWNDDEYTTEQGAYGVAFIVASKEMKVKAIEKSKKKSGIDYWLGDKEGFLFQEKVRLEVSGIRKGNDYQFQKRFDDKMTQSKKSDRTRLPALIIIIGFDGPRIKTGLRNKS